MPNTQVLNKEEKRKVVLLWGKYEDIAKVCREFALCFGIHKHPKKVPDVRVFQRVVDRFLETGSVEVAPAQRTKTTKTEENVKEIHRLIKGNNAQLSSFPLNLKLAC